MRSDSAGRGKEAAVLFRRFGSVTLRRLLISPRRTRPLGSRGEKERDQSKVTVWRNERHRSLVLSASAPGMLASMAGRRALSEPIEVTVDRGTWIRGLGPALDIADRLVHKPETITRDELKVIGRAVECYRAMIYLSRVQRDRVCKALRQFDCDFYGDEAEELEDE